MKHCPSHPNPDGSRGADLPEEAFYAEPKRYDGLSSVCKECKKARNRRYHREVWYPAHREEQKAAVTERRRERRGLPRRVCRNPACKQRFDPLRCDQMECSLDCTKTLRRVARSGG